MSGSNPGITVEKHSYIFFLATQTLTACQRRIALQVDLHKPELKQKTGMLVCELGQKYKM